MALLYEKGRYAYFRLKRYYDGNQSQNLRECYKRSNTIFWVRIDKEFNDLDSFLQGEDICLILEDNAFGINFDSSYFELINRDEVIEALAQKEVNDILKTDQDEQNKPF